MYWKPKCLTLFYLIIKKNIAKLHFCPYSPTQIFTWLICLEISNWGFTSLTWFPVSPLKLFSLLINDCNKHKWCVLITRSAGAQIKQKAFGHSLIIWISLVMAEACVRILIKFAQELCVCYFSSCNVKENGSSHLLKVLGIIEKLDLGSQISHVSLEGAE